MTEHFVAEIKVTKVVKRDSDTVPTRTASPLPPLRQKGTVASIVVSSSNVSDLKLKVNSHFELIDDDGVEMTDG